MSESVTVEQPPVEQKVKSPAREPKEARKKYVEKGDKPERQGGAKAEGDAPKVEGEHKEKNKEHKEKDKDHKEQPKRERHKRERKQFEEYDYDPSIITEETKIPKPPKKHELKQRPDEKVYKQREADIQARIVAAQEKRKKILAERFEREKKTVTKEGDGEKNVFEKFEAEKEKVIELREQFHELLDNINEKKRKIEEAKADLKKLDDDIRAIDKSRKGDTKENIFEKLRRLEHELLTASLSLKEEKELNMEIEGLKRMIGNAQSSENLEVDLARLKEKREEKQKEVDNLYTEKKKFNEQFQPVRDALDKQNELVNKLKEEGLQRKEENKQFREDVDKEKNAFYDKKTERKEAVDNEIAKLRDSKDALWDEYYKNLDEHIQQQKYINFIEWQQRQQDRLVKKRDYEERKKKREEREKEGEAKEAFRVRKYNTEITTCEYLIDYCGRLRPAEKVVLEQEKVPQVSKADIEAQLQEDKTWAKEKGLTVLENKKSRGDDEDNSPKKGKKGKKGTQDSTAKGEKEGEKKEEKKVKFSHDINIIGSFDIAKCQLPLSTDDLDRTVKELQEKLAYYLKMSEEDAKEAKLAKEAPAEEVKKEEVKAETPSS